MPDTADTIFAFATPPGRSGVAVLRISGPQASRVLREMAAPPYPKPRQAALRTLSDPRSGSILDEALVLWMPGPASFTGEDVVELHLHGGLAVCAAVSAALSRFGDSRPAEPGEFTRRAFLAGKMDLSQVEGLADLIDAETEAQRRQALRQASGALRHVLEGWRGRLLDAAALIEASLDFADEDLPSDLVETCGEAMATVTAEMSGVLDTAVSGEILRQGLHVVIAGPPNAGKSTLLNRLARRDVAIVSPIAGTTRDAIEVRCDLDGCLVTFVDTAGLRESNDPVERIGIARARDAVRTADLVLSLQAADAALETTGVIAEAFGAACIRLITKCDLVDPAILASHHLAVSADTGQGVDALLARIRDVAVSRAGSGDALVTRERHRLAIEEARDALGRAGQAMLARHDVLVAEDLRLALRAIGRVSGRVDVDDVLDRVFGRFCIGK